MQNKPLDNIIICEALTGFTCDLDGSYCKLFLSERCNPKEKKKEIKLKMMEDKK